MLPDTDVSRTYSGLSTRGFRVYVARSSELINWVPGAEARRLAKASRYNLAVLLHGQMAIRRGNETLDLEPGDWMLETPMGGELWYGQRFEVLVVEWERALSSLHVPTTQSGYLTPVQLTQLRVLADDITSQHPDAADRSEQVSRALGILDLDVHVPQIPWTAQDQLLLQAVADMASSIGSQPMWPDLERRLGTSERQLRRRLHDLYTRLGIPTTGGLRGYLLHIRLQTALAFLTGMGVSVQQVAAAVGYGSSRAMGTAFRQAGLSSPGKMRRQVLAADGL